MPDVFKDKQELALAAADAFCELARDCVSQRGVFRVSLSGGSTPKGLYELLAKRDLPWNQIEWYWGDERNVNPSHDDSNAKMVREALLNHLPQENVHAFAVPVNVDDPAQTAIQYESTLRSRFEGQDWPVWDLALLGMGDDAHTASLFPETEAITENQRWFVENFVPKFDAYRYTLTAPAINSAIHRWFLISGENKREAVSHTSLAASPPAEAQPSLYPVQLIDRVVSPSPARWFVTQDAVL